MTATAGAGAVNLAGPITLGAAQTWSNNGGNALTVSGNVANAGNTLTLGGSGAVALTSVVSGAGGLGKSGAGTATLSGANTFSGAVAVNGGTLKAGVASVAGVSGAFGNGTAVTLANTPGAALDITGFNTQIGSLAGGGASGGNVTLGAAALTVAGTGTTTYSGVIAGSGGSLVKTGSGSLTLAGNTSNTYTGGTTLTTGVLGLAKTGGAYAIPGDFTGNNINSPDVFATTDNQFAPGAVMRFTGTGGDHVRFELLGTTQTLAGIDNSLSSGYGVIQHKEQVGTAAVSSLSTLVLNGTGTYSFNAYLRDTGGRVALSKTGSGTQTLSGTVIDYTGITTLAAGRLNYVDLDDMHSAGIAMSTGTVVEFANTARSFARFTNTLISGDGTFIKSGSNLMTTGNSGGYARWAMTGGTIDVQQGEFRVDYQDQALAWVNNKAAMNVASGATVSMVGGNHISVDALTGAGTVQNINNWGTGIFTVGQNNGSGTFTGIPPGQWRPACSEQDRRRHPDPDRPQHLYRGNHRQRRHVAG
ncbi:MAG: autotransporter-associated beta strand repeat-containing protein [Kiritimatiellia bacterium]